MSGRLGKRPVAGDDRRIDCLCEGDVHGVVRADVDPQLPRAPQEIEMGVTVEIEFFKIRNRFAGTAGRHFARSHEPPETLNHFDIHEVRGMGLRPRRDRGGISPGHQARSLQEKFQQEPTRRSTIMRTRALRG